MLVCYECLKHSPNKMETCSSCYFALFCSENCKKQHEKQTCVIQLLQHHTIEILDTINKNGITTKKLIEKKLHSPSHLNFLEKYCKNIV